MPSINNRNKDQSKTNLKETKSMDWTSDYQRLCNLVVDLTEIYDDCNLTKLAKVRRAEIQERKNAM